MMFLAPETANSGQFYGANKKLGVWVHYAGVVSVRRAHDSATLALYRLDKTLPTCCVAIRQMSLSVRDAMLRGRAWLPWETDAGGHVGAACVVASRRRATYGT